MLAAGLLPLCVLAAILVMVACSVHDACLREREGHVEEATGGLQSRSEVEVVYVMESPRPTMSVSQPFSPTPDLAVRRRNLLAATRGGARRWKAHSRSSTTICDPKLPHHCAYVCALRMVKKKPTIKEVKKLRTHVADLVEQGYYRGDHVQGMRVNDALKQVGMDISTYVADIRGTQWASIIELHYVAKYYNISFYVRMGSHTMHLGVGKTNVCMVLNNGHYTLKRGTMRYVRAEKGVLSRGGMSSHSHDPMESQENTETTLWTWESQENQQPIPLLPSDDTPHDPLHVQEACQDDDPVPIWAWAETFYNKQIAPAEGEVTVFIGQSIRTDIKKMDLVVPASISVGSLKVRLSEILGMTKDRMIIVLPQDPNMSLPDWTQLPRQIIVDDVLTVPLKDVDYINVYMAATRQDFLIPVRSHATDEDVVLAISKVVGCLPSQVALTDQRGMNWTYSRARRRASYVVLTVLPRGGMDRLERFRASSRSRSVSPTMPYRPRQTDPMSSSSSQDIPHQFRGTRQPDPQGPEEEHQEPPNQPCLRTPPARNYDVEERGSDYDRDNDDLSSDAHVYSAIWPESPPAAQPSRIRRPVLVDDQLIAYIYACPMARVYSVLTEMDVHLNLWAPLAPEPRDSQVWNQVRSIRINAPPPVRAYRPYDLRRGTWEFLQRHRLVPVITNGHVTSTLILTMDMDLQMAYRRVQAATHLRRYWQMVTFGYDTWYVHSLQLPESVQEALDELQHYRDRLLRGGMPAGSRVLFTYVHAIESDHYYVMEYDEEVVAQLIVYISEYLPYHTDDIVAITDQHVLHLDDPLDALLEQHLYIILLAHMDNFRWPWTKMEMLVMAIYQRGRTSRDYETQLIGPYSVEADAEWANMFELCRGGRRDGVCLHLPYHNKHWKGKKEVETAYTMFEEEPYMMKVTYRGGMQQPPQQSQQPQQRDMDPRHMMITWALQKASREAPEACQATVQMLCRAENRTVMALLNAKSPAQTKHVLEAAYRRAGMMSPFAQPTQPLQPQADHPDMEELKEMVKAQGNMVAVMSNLVAQIPSSQSYSQVMMGFKASQDATIEAMTSFTAAISGLERRLERVEHLRARPQEMSLTPMSPPPNMSMHEQNSDEQAAPSTPVRSTLREGEGHQRNLDQETPTPVYSTPARSQGELSDPEQPHQHGDQDQRHQQQQPSQRSTEVIEVPESDAEEAMVSSLGPMQSIQQGGNSNGIFSAFAERSLTSQARRAIEPPPEQ